MNEEVIEMGLCEAAWIFLRPNVLYRFIVMKDCEECAKLAAHYTDEKPLTNETKHDRISP